MRGQAAVIFLVMLSGCASKSMTVASTSTESELKFAYQESGASSSITQLSITPEVELSFSDDVSLVASGRLRLDPADDLSPDKPTLDSYSDYSQPLTLGDQGTAELRDFYLEFDAGALDWRIGKQQIVWGQLDGFKNLDAVNPQSFREFILDDFESSRIGLWTVAADFNVNAWNAQVFWAPDSTVHELPDQGSTFSLSAPRFIFGANRIDFSEVQVNYPDSELDDAAYGVRLNTSAASGLDIAVSYLSGLDHSPVGRSFVTPENKIRLIQEYQRRDVWGLSVSKAARNFVLRAELGYRPKRAFSVIQHGELFIEQRDQVTAAIGLDLDGPGNWFTNIQYLYDRVENTDSALLRPRQEKIMTLFTRRSWRNETLFFDFKWYSAESFSDGLMRPEIRYLVNDSVTASIGVDAFYGDADGIFGQFEENDRVVFKLQHIF